MTAILGYLNLLEQVAAFMHQKWAKWTKYFLENLSEKNKQRWKRQAETPYELLSVEEQKSDIQIARELLFTIHQFNKVNITTTREARKQLLALVTFLEELEKDLEEG